MLLFNQICHKMEIQIFLFLYLSFLPFANMGDKIIVMSLAELKTES